MATFFVPGIPVPKGSAKAFMRKGMRFPVVIQDNADKQKPWASIIGVTAAGVIAQPTTQPVKLEVAFWMPRPKAHLGKAGVKDNAPFRHTKKPDLDKLLRCVKDALTGIAWIDDSQVCDVVCSKNYAISPGAGITITPLN